MEDSSPQSKLSDKNHRFLLPTFLVLEVFVHFISSSSYRERFAVMLIMVVTYRSHSPRIFFWPHRKLSNKMLTAVLDPETLNCQKPCVSVVRQTPLKTVKCGRANTGSE